MEIPLKFNKSVVWDQKANHLAYKQVDLKTLPQISFKTKFPIESNLVSLKILPFLILSSKINVQIRVLKVL